MSRTTWPSSLPRWDGATSRASSMFPSPCRPSPCTPAFSSISSFCWPCASFSSCASPAPAAARSGWPASTRPPARSSRSCFPDLQDQCPGFNVDCIYQPAEQVGGDFFQQIGDGQCGMLIVVGDVSGKGLPAAMLVSVLVGAIRAEAAHSHRPRRPAALAQRPADGRAAWRLHHLPGRAHHRRRPADPGQRRPPAALSQRRGGRRSRLPAAGHPRAARTSSAAPSSSRLEIASPSSPTASWKPSPSPPRNPHPEPMPSSASSARARSAASPPRSSPTPPASSARPTTSPSSPSSSAAQAFPPSPAEPPRCAHCPPANRSSARALDPRKRSLRRRHHAHQRVGAPVVKEPPVVELDEPLGKRGPRRVLAGLLVRHLRLQVGIVRLAE